MTALSAVARIVEEYQPEAESVDLAVQEAGLITVELEERPEGLITIDLEQECIERISTRLREMRAAYGHCEGRRRRTDAEANSGGADS